jgi:CheY-like chemotaxis protein
MSTYKVLIAEDNKLLASIISEILTDLNIETVTVNSGEDVITAYNRDYFDMVLIDIMMPDTSGLEASKEIRKTNSHIPIVALTSLAYEDIKDELAACGINHYISKPPNAEELQSLLSEYFKTAA